MVPGLSPNARRLMWRHSQISLEHQAINQNRLMLSFLTGRAGFREKPDSTFSPGALVAAEIRFVGVLTSINNALTNAARAFEEGM